MVKQLFWAAIFALLAAGCSGSIYRQRPVQGTAPVAIAVDARQRVLLSQLDPTSKAKAAQDPLFRRFCAEPSPDVFTVLGVSGSGGGNLGLGADKSVNAALQAAFSSSETGATIARTQTLNMLREMMFRTCERYLSGAISADEFPIVAARDQRIMVSILAIEQLTGSITPRALTIGAGGSATTGLNPTELVKALADAQGAVKAADDDLSAKAKKQTEADNPGGTCATLKQKKAAGTPALSTDETNKLKACEDADAAHSASKAKRDAAKEHYDALVAASKGGLGTSSASTSTSGQFASPMERSAAVGEVARAVSAIVQSTFEQDETQLFCIRVLNPPGEALNDAGLREQCLRYLVEQVRGERAELARRYGLSQASFDMNFDAGRGDSQRTEDRALQLNRCATDPARSTAFETAVRAWSELPDTDEETFLRDVRASPTAAEGRLLRLGPEAEDRLMTALASACR